MLTDGEFTTRIRARRVTVLASMTRVPRVSSLLAALAAVAAGTWAGCSTDRVVTVVPALPHGCAPRGASELVLNALGDFPPNATMVGSAPIDGQITLSLPSATRVLSIEGIGSSGIVAFGRSGPLTLAGSANRLAIAYGPPDGICATSAMSYARSGHSATLLPTGDVLLAGGIDGSGHPVARLELYVPGGDLLTPPATFRVVDAGGATMLNARAALGHAVAVLPGGDLIITGGAPAGDGGAPSGSAFEVATHHLADGTLEGVALVLFAGPRAFHTATALPDGRVLLAGGCARYENGHCMEPVSTTEVYQPVSRTFSAGPPLLSTRYGHQAILRGDGTVLLIGGKTSDAGPEPVAELVDPDELRGQALGPSAGLAARVFSGAVLVAGGSDRPSTRVSLLADEDLAEQLLDPLPEARMGHTVTALEDGAALVAGGGDDTALATGLVVIDARGRSSNLGTYQRRGHTATRLLDGTVLLAGGGDDLSGTASADAAIYFRSPLGPYSTVPTLTLGDASDPLALSRPDRVRFTDGRLEILGDASASASPTSKALLAGEALSGFLINVLAGRSDPEAEAAIVYGYVSEASYGFVSLKPGAKVTAYRVSFDRPGHRAVTAVEGCTGETLAEAELPLDDVAPINVEVRDGLLQVGTGPRLLLRCDPKEGSPRGAVGLGARLAAARFDNLAVTR
jgi:hypothetical protein